MKKFMSLLLALVLCFSLSTVALAAEDTSSWTTDVTETTIKLTKLYTVNGGKVTPTETLTFVVTADDSNPDTTKKISVADLVVTGTTGEMAVTLPIYDKVGTYKYTVAEAAGTALGATYDSVSIPLTVLVTYDYKNSKLSPDIVLGNGTQADAKDSQFENTYDLGSLTVEKQVTGNLGDENKEFEITVTFTNEANATTPVKNAISYTSDGEEKTISIEDMADGSQAVVINLHDGESVTFENIPAGVTYTVVEADYTQGDKNSENGYDAPVYAFSDDSKTIAAKDADTVTVTNNKETSIATGITMDSMPYIVMLAMVVVAGVLFLNKRRNAEY